MQEKNDAKSWVWSSMQWPVNFNIKLPILTLNGKEDSSKFWHDQKRHQKRTKKNGIEDEAISEGLYHVSDSGALLIFIWQWCLDNLGKIQPPPRLFRNKISFGWHCVWLESNVDIETEN